MRTTSILLLLLGTSPAWAEGHAVGARLGSLGLGIEYAYAFSDRLGVRVGLNGGSFGFNAEESGIDYAFDLEWDSALAAIDFHPFAGAFRLQAGMLRNDNTLIAESTPSGPIDIGGTSYSPAEVGVLSGVIGFDGTAPLLGFGWDWSRTRRVGVALDFGLVYQGTPVASLWASGGLLDAPELADDIATEERELQEALEDFELLPYATLSVVFRF